MSHDFNTCHMTLSHSESEVIHYYRMMSTLSRGEAILKYLEIILSLPMYSVHFFDVKVCEGVLSECCVCVE